jgi:hypothetical protein
MSLADCRLLYWPFINKLLQRDSLPRFINILFVGRYSLQTVFTFLGKEFITWGRQDFFGFVTNGDVDHMIRVKSMKLLKFWCHHGGSVEHSGKWWSNVLSVWHWIICCCLCNVAVNPLCNELAAEVVYEFLQVILSLMHHFVRE